MDQTQQPGIQIAQIFLKQAKFDRRPEYLWTPPAGGNKGGRINISIAVLTGPDGPTGVSMVVATDNDDPGNCYIYEVEMAVLFQVIGEAPNMSLEEFARINVATLLVPFLREVIGNITGRERYGPVWVNPINVMALLKQQQES